MELSAYAIPFGTAWCHSLRIGYKKYFNWCKTTDFDRYWTRKLVKKKFTSFILLYFAATLVIVMVTVVICGGSTVSLLTFFDIPLGVEDEEDKSPLSSSATPNHNYSSMADAQVPVGSTPADKSIAAQPWARLWTLQISTTVLRIIGDWSQFNCPADTLVWRR